MSPLTLVTIGNPKMAKDKKPDGEGRRRRKKNPSFGHRFKRSIKSSGNDAMLVGGMLLGNVAAQMFRSQVIARIPVNNIAGHGIDLAADWLALAPAMEAMLPGNFGRGVALGVRFNSAAAAVKTMMPQGSTASRMLSVSEFVPELPAAPVEAPATGSTVPPGAKYNGPLGRTSMPGNQGSNVGLRRAG